MAKVAVDKISAEPVLHDHDEMRVNSLIFVDSAGIEWKLTVDTDGAVITTLADPTPLQGNPIGLLLTLTYPANQ